MLDGKAVAAPFGEFDRETIPTYYVVLRVPRYLGM
jgi:hypothetical protein